MSHDYMIYLFCNPKSGGNQGAVLIDLKVHLFLPLLTPLGFNNRELIPNIIEPLQSDTENIFPVKTRKENGRSP